MCSCYMYIVLEGGFVWDMGKVSGVHGMTREVDARDGPQRDSIRGVTAGDMEDVYRCVLF